MNENFEAILTVGGKTNSLGRASEVIDIVLHDKSRLDELYNCILHEDAWVRMRAVDAFEKICRQHPEWLLPYVNRFADELATSTQPSIQWHLAEIYAQVELTTEQKSFAIRWLKQLLSSVGVDWIVAANAMNTLAQFVRDGSVSESELIILLKLQQQHRSKSVVRRASKLLETLT